MEYQETNYHRKSQLFEEQFLSDADLQEAKLGYRTSLANVKALKATYEKKLIAFKNNKVYAPASGIIIHIEYCKRRKISSNFKWVYLLSLAPDIKQIEADLDIITKRFAKWLKDKNANGSQHLSQ